MGNLRDAVDVGNVAVGVPQGLQVHRSGLRTGNYPAIADPNPSYPGISFVDAAGPAAFVTYIRAILLRDTGAAISPFNAFLLLQGVETLSLRLERHAENTKKVVEYLAKHPQVERVNHPSLPDHPDSDRILLFVRQMPCTVSRAGHFGRTRIIQRQTLSPDRR